jgi:hypothetical protein
MIKALYKTSFSRFLYFKKLNIKKDDLLKQLKQKIE